jgi:hypothetical protein
MRVRHSVATLQAIKSRGLRLSDVIQRFKFYDGVATAAYSAGFRKTAVGCAKQAIGLNQQMPEAAQNVVQDEVIDIVKVSEGRYNHHCFTRRRRG